MKRGYRKDIEILKFVVVLAVFVVVLVVVYYFFLQTEECKDNECFAESLFSCERVSWINDAEEASWFYVIKGKSKGECKVEVKLLVAKEGKLDMEKAEGKSMVCSIPIGVIVSPEKELSRCTGPLKEELQDLIIKRMHSYILENLGEISEEMSKGL